MSIRLMAMVWNNYLSSTEKLVLLYYADRASDDGSKIFPSNSTVVKATSLSERSVRSTTRKLIEKGYLQHTGWSGYHTKTYTIDVSRLIEGIEGGTTCRKEGQDVPETGAGCAPKPLVDTSKPSYKKYQKKFPETYSSPGYVPLINQQLQKALETIYEN